MPTYSVVFCDKGAEAGGTNTEAQNASSDSLLKLGMLGLGVKVFLSLISQDLPTIRGLPINNSPHISIVNDPKKRTRNTEPEKCKKVIQADLWTSA